MSYFVHVVWAESREQRIARYEREGSIVHRKDGELDMRYASSKFIADPKADGMLHPAQ